MKLYIVGLKHGSAKTDDSKNYRVWIGIEPSYQDARKKSLAILKGYKVLFYVGIKLGFNLIHLLPMFNTKDESCQKK